MQQAKVLAPGTIPYSFTEDSSISASTQVTLDGRCEYIRITAEAQAVYLLMGAGTASSSNAHYKIPAGMVMDFIKPKTTAGADITEINLIEAASGATVTVTQL